MLNQARVRYVEMLKDDLKIYPLDKFIKVSTLLFGIPPNIAVCYHFGITYNNYLVYILKMQNTTHVMRKYVYNLVGSENIRLRPMVSYACGWLMSEILNQHLNPLDLETLGHLMLGNYLIEDSTIKVYITNPFIHDTLLIMIDSIENIEYIKYIPFMKRTFETYNELFKFRTNAFRPNLGNILTELAVSRHEPKLLVSPIMEKIKSVDIVFYALLNYYRLSTSIDDIFYVIATKGAERMKDKSKSELLKLEYQYRLITMANYFWANKSDRFKQEDKYMKIFNQTKNIESIIDLNIEEKSGAIKALLDYIYWYLGTNDSEKLEDGLKQLILFFSNEDRTKYLSCHPLYKIMTKLQKGGHEYNVNDWQTLQEELREYKKNLLLPPQ